ncbi:tetratricopeptide repeat protein [Pedobacter sp. AW31-3R]|uniref:tetratricopeptide repeat protein n=1 Tax=Pedobacter sp. AW31-3R TaxID=3445781 RepID=UPI003FA080AB
MKLNKLIRAALLWLCMGIPGLTFAKSQADALFEKGNSFYAKAQYKAALDTYQKILDEGYSSAPVYFNMGNASYKLEDLPSAILYYEKAHKFLPGDADINFNIRFANSKTVDKIEQVPDFFINVWLKSLILRFSAQTLAVFSLLFILLGSGLLIVYFFSALPLLKKSAFFTAVTLFFLGLFCIFMGNRQLSYFEDNQQGIIFASTVTVKSEPGEKARALFVVHEGTKVNILEKKDSWIKVGLANGNEGWMNLNELKEI